MGDSSLIIVLLFWPLWNKWSYLSHSEVCWRGGERRLLSLDRDRRREYARNVAQMEHLSDTKVSKLKKEMGILIEVVWQVKWQEKR